MNLVNSHVMLRHSIDSHKSAVLECIIKEIPMLDEAHLYFEVQPINTERIILINIDAVIDIEIVKDGDEEPELIDIEEREIT